MCDARRHANAYGHALDDLCEIARRVFRRKQRELRAGSRREAFDDAFDRPIVDAIIRMAQSLGLEVIAEGVETQGQLDALGDLGGQFAQGFLWARPMRPEDAVRWLQAHAYLGKS